MTLIPVDHDPFAEEAADEEAPRRPSSRSASDADEAPIEAGLRQRQLAEDLRAAHLARDDAIPLLGKTMPVTPPPHIQTAADMQDLVGRYADLAERGAAYRDWYTASGQAILGHAGDDPEMADRIAAALAATSPRTDVAANVMHAITMHNQAMVGDPLRAGAFPQSMGSRAERIYYAGEPLRGFKIEPFLAATAEEWNPNFAHSFVNDTHNMRAAEFPGDKGGLYTQGAPVGEQYGAKGASGHMPTIGEHNFTRILANLAADELARRGGIPWTPKQVQAAGWTGIKSLNENRPVDEAGFDFARGLARHYAQLSWESAPGQTTGHLPEYFAASPAEQQAFHDAMLGVLTDEQGSDLIARHLGLLTGPTLRTPGVFEGRVSPGAQAQVAAGRLAGGLDVDPATRDLLNASEAVRGLLLRQDAAAWHKPAYRAKLTLGQANMSDVDFGRPMTGHEALAAAEAMAEASGSDFFSPIATARGFRFLNVPEVSGIDNKGFHAAVDKALTDSRLPGVAQVTRLHADGGYIPNDWSKEPNGESYLQTIARTGRPDLQRAAAQLLATLGPRVSQVEEDFARRLGWTPNRDTRVWETDPIIARHAGAVIPTPPRPWITRPAPQGGPSLFRLVPVEHDPFAEAAE